MKMYQCLLLTYLAKYKRLDVQVLAQELDMTEGQIVNLAYGLSQNGYCTIQRDICTVTPLGKEFVLPMWNDWSKYAGKDSRENQQNFTWDYLYIPQNML